MAGYIQQKDNENILDLFFQLCPWKSKSPQGGTNDRYGLTPFLLIDGVRFNELFTLDFRELIRSVSGNGHFDILTCTCGEAGCEYLDGAIVVRHTLGHVYWRVRRPLQANDDDVRIDFDNYVFQAGQYREALAVGLAQARRMLAHYKPEDIFLFPEGFEVKNLLELEVPEGLLEAATSTDYIKIMADYGWAYAWDAAGVECGLRHLGVPAQLEQKFIDWANWFNKSEDEELDWKMFHRAGISLAQELKRVVGEQVEVLYHRPFGDPNQDERQIMIEM